jgi:fucose 4-O-acetylase-like acetyltransferase
MLPLQPQGAFRLTLLHEIATSGACSNRPYRENLMSGAPLPPSTKRDERLDGYKGLLILFVVIGHAIEILRFPGTSLSVYLAIYAFHMPAFLLIAGALTRARRPADELVETARRLAPPYLFGVVGAALIRLAESGTLSVSFFPPPWTLWFLLTLATLRIASSLIGANNVALVVAILVGVLASIVTLPAELSLGRSASLAIFFLIGVRLRAPRLLALVERIGALGGVALALLGIALAGATLVAFDLPRSALHWREAMVVVTGDPLQAIVISFALHLAALAASLGLFACFIRLPRPSLLALLGRETLAIYLGHALLLSALRPSLRTLDLTGAEVPVAITLLAAVVLLLPLIAQRLLRRLGSRLHNTART